MINEWTKDVEIIEIAMATEQRAFEFYSAAAENSSDFFIKQIFSTLALEEEVHLKNLSGRFNTPIDSLPLKSIKIPKDINVYYAAFQKMIETPDFDKSIEEIIQMSLEFEKRGEEFYLTSAKVVESKESQKILEELALDEVKHYLMLKEALSNYKKKEVS